MTQSLQELADRYFLLCRSTEAGVGNDPLGLRLAPHLQTLKKLLKQDLRALGRQGSPDDFADICFELEHEFERFEEFCSHPSLAQKFVVAFGGCFSAGKSSLINTLLGKRLLVTEVDPTTSLPTYLLQAEEDAIFALNLFRHRIRLSEAEFLSLTHDEVARYGSNVSRLLRSAIIASKDFPWQNLAIIDTPGYTRHEDREHSERTDEHIARTQLNSAQAIVWVIDARQGCITEDDLQFIGSLRQDIPRLIALSRADQKPEEDIANIVEGIRRTLQARNIPFIDVVPTSARSKKWPLTSITNQLQSWNQESRELRFAHNFKHQFLRYARHLDDERRQAQQQLNRLNRILAVADETSIQQDAEELKQRTENLLHSTERLRTDLAAYRQRFFSELKIVGDQVGIPLPEPDELELIGEQGFDLLKVLRHQREAEGKAAPDEPAALGELSHHGQATRLTDFLTSQQPLHPHFATKLDVHCRESYIRFLAAIACHAAPWLTDTQSELFHRLQASLSLDDSDNAILAQARNMDESALHESQRIIKEYGLGYNLLFDALMMCRTAGPFDRARQQLFAELASALTLENDLMDLCDHARYVSGITNTPQLKKSSILALHAWTPLYFKKMTAEHIADGKLKEGYYFLENKIVIKKKSATNGEIDITNSFVLFNNHPIGFKNEHLHANIINSAIHNASLHTSKIEKSEFINSQAESLRADEISITNSTLVSSRINAIINKIANIKESQITNSEICFYVGGIWPTGGIDLKISDSKFNNSNETQPITVEICRYKFEIKDTIIVTRCKFNKKHPIRVISKGSITPPDDHLHASESSHSKNEIFETLNLHQTNKTSLSFDSVNFFK